MPGDFCGVSMPRPPPYQPDEGLTSLPTELLVRAVAFLPSAEHVARADCVSRLFHESLTPPDPPSVCEQALRLRAEWSGRSVAAALAEGEASRIQALL